MPPSRAHVHAVLLSLVLGVLLASTPVAAQAVSPDEEVARRWYDRGLAAYDRADYQGAIQAFVEARRVIPSPAFEYNIGRCHDRLGAAAEAISAYERYLASAPVGPGLDEAKERVRVLRARIEATVSTAVPVEALSHRHHSLVAPAVLAGVAGASLAVGGALLGVAFSRYDALEGGCGQTRTCDPETVLALRPYDYTGKALLGVGGAALAIDVGMWIWSARRR